MFERGNEWLVPEWIKILLDLVNYKYAPLKEIAISYLISSFSQNTNFISAMQDVQLIWMPHMSKIYFDVRADIFSMRRHTVSSAPGGESFTRCRPLPSLTPLVQVLHCPHLEQQSTTLLTIDSNL